MNHAALKANERELIKLIRFFSKRAQRLAEEGGLNAQHTQLSEACQNLETQLQAHARNRTAILEKRAQLDKIIEDNALCPACGKADMLKQTGATTTERGWKCNTYKCRRCNIAFTWNRPNNPWHMAEFMEVYSAELELSLLTEQNDALRTQTQAAVAHLQESLSRLRPVLKTSDEEVRALEEKERAMDKLIHQFRNYLLIEKIKLDSWQEPEV